MNEFELNKIPSLIKDGSLTEKQAVNKIAVFIFKNQPLFKLQKYDEDFRGEVIKEFIEKGIYFLKHYNPKIGNFFPFLFINIEMIVQKKIKSYAKHSVQEYCTIFDETTEALFDIEKYGIFTPVFMSERKPPYAVKTVSASDLQENIKQNPVLRKKKILFIVLLKYIYFIDEKALYDICIEHELNYEQLIKYANICRESLYKKIQKIHKKELSRNKEYFFHKNYNSRLYNLSNEIMNAKKYQAQKMNRKLNVHTKIWVNKNYDLEKQFGNLVTSNKVIAKLLNLCERQVRYYIETVWALHKKAQNQISDS